MKLSSLSTLAKVLFASFVLLQLYSAGGWAGKPDDNIVYRHDGISGGALLSSRARPSGISLADAAAMTAHFNATDHSGPVPDTPFQMLYTTPTNTFSVKEDTVLYVPIMFFDDSYPVVGHFPTDVSDRKALIHYIYSQDEEGLVEATIVVDGRKYGLGKNYIASAKLDTPLTDFIPPATEGGKQYATVAVFLSPLKEGTHTVEIRGHATGAAIEPWSEILKAAGYVTDTFTEQSFSIVYTVNVED